MLACAAGLVAGVEAARSGGGRLAADPRAWLELACLGLVGCWIAAHPVALPSVSREDEATGFAAVSLAFVAAFAAMLRHGPLAGLAVAALAAAAGCRWPVRRGARTAAFTVSLAAVETYAASQVYCWLQAGAWTFDSPGQVPAAIVAGACMYVVNSTGRALALSAAGQARFGALWKQDFLWIAPAYVGLTCMTALPLLLGQNSAYGLLALTVPFAFLSHKSLKSYAQHAHDERRHVEELEAQRLQLEDLYMASIKSLALAIDAKDQYTHEHILRVQRYAVAIAERLGVTGRDLEAVRTGALLHDIGKLGVPEHLLLKPGRLTEEEFTRVKKHTLVGASILDPVNFPWPVLPVVKHHHERWDGTGYPSGIRDVQIPLTARILAIADVYDALTSVRSYRDAWTHEQAVQEIRRSSGSHFDPQVVSAFLAVIDGVVAEMAAEGTGPKAPAGVKDKHLSAPTRHAVAEIRQASSELWELYQIAQSLTAGLGVRATLDILAPKLEALLPDAGCAVLLNDKAGDCLVVEAAVGLNREFFEGCRTCSLVSQSAVVARMGKPYVGKYCPDDILLKSREPDGWAPLRSALIVPLQHEGETMGTLNIYRRTRNGFSSDDVRLVHAVAQRTASALYSATLYDRAQASASTDPLTGLHNIRFLTEAVERRCAAGSGGTGARRNGAARAADRFSVLCIDLDSFKPINDNFGHQRGDRVLREIARVLKSGVRDGDIVSRYGGDEFLIVLNCADAEEAAAMAARLEQAVERHDLGLTHEKFGRLNVGASVGYACFPKDGVTCAELLAAADARMYQHKTERKLQKLAASPPERDARAGDRERAEVLRAAA